MPPLEIPFEEYKNKSLKIPFEEAEILEEISNVLTTDPEKVAFVIPPHAEMVDVYIGTSLLYKITKEMYETLTQEEDQIQAMKDCGV